ncbi:GRP family sugar transporter [Dellaglioa sp. L3N]
MAKIITVLGSTNIDKVISVPRFAKSGETLHTSNHQIEAMGGKGLNQGVAAARSGAKTNMITKVGKEFDTSKNMNVENLSTDHVMVSETEETGQAYITVSAETGDNIIHIYGGANADMTASDVRAHAAAIAESDFLITQLEVPMEAVIEGFKIARENGVKTILNPAPMPENGNWGPVSSKTYGFMAVIIILIGAYLTTYQEKKSAGNKELLTKAVGVLLIAQVGYSLYGILPQYTKGTDGMHMFLAQAMGMAAFGLILGLYEVMKNKNNIFSQSITYKQIFSGFFFAMAALGYLVSAQPAMLGLATGFVLSQVSIVGATISGILVMRTKKTGKEWLVIAIGLVLIVIAAAVTVFLKN